MTAKNSDHFRVFASFCPKLPFIWTVKPLNYVIKIKIAELFHYINHFYWIFLINDFWLLKVNNNLFFNYLFTTCHFYHFINEFWFCLKNDCYNICKKCLNKKKMFFNCFCILFSLIKLKLQWKCYLWLNMICQHHYVNFSAFICEINFFY